MSETKGTYASKSDLIPFPIYSNVCTQDAEDRSVGLQIQQSLVPAVRLELFPKSTIYVFITIIEADGIESCIASGAIAASAALAHAGIEMLGLVISCSAVSVLSLDIK